MSERSNACPKSHAQYTRNVGLEQYESILKYNDIDLDILIYLRPEEFMNMAKDLGIYSWAHRHELNKVIEESNRHPCEL